MAQSRKRRKERGRAAASKPQRLKGSDPLSADDSRGLTPSGNGGSSAVEEPAPRGYARSRAKNEAARAALEPLEPGERPGAVTVGAIVAALLAAANLIAVVFGWNGAIDDDDTARALAGSLLVTGLLCAIAWGMWRAKYWAVLGMQTLLALTVIASALGLVTAENAAAMLVLILIIAAAGTLFWFMVKAMARIQMPERPSRVR